MVLLPFEGIYANIRYINAYSDLASILSSLISSLYKSTKITFSKKFEVQLCRYLHKLFFNIVFNFDWYLITSLLIY